MSFAINPLGFAAPPWGFRSFPCRFEPDQISFRTSTGILGIFPCGIESFRCGMKSFRCGKESFPHFGPSMIGLVLEQYRFTRFQYCSVPYPSVLATDPSFFAPAPCGSGGEKTVHEGDLQICDWRHEPPESADNRRCVQRRHCCESSRIATCARRHRHIGRGGQHAGTARKPGSTAAALSTLFD